MSEQTGTGTSGTSGSSGTGERALKVDAGLDVPAPFVDAVVARVRDDTEHVDVEPLLQAAKAER